MRRETSVLHLDLDAFFAAVEQRDKPSLRGRPVVVGGVGGRGVVATASYEARAYGARSAMSTAEARRRCPSGTAFLGGRFAAYRRTSDVVMGLLRGLSPLVEPVSIDEAYVDLAAADGLDLSVDGVTVLGNELKERIAAATGGVTGSIGIGLSILSYNGHVQFGLIADGRLVPDPHAAIRHFRSEFDKLLYLALMGDWDIALAPATADAIIDAVQPATESEPAGA